MKIFITGSRGIPDIPGGVEKHCQELYPLIANMGHDVHVATRKSYVLNKQQHTWNNVNLVPIYGPLQKSFEAIVHTLLSVIEAWKLNVDIIHVHAVGPGLLVPFAKFLGLKVVITNHGPDYDRQKWGMAAKFMLRLGEYLGGMFADNVIVISTPIQNIVKTRCKKESYIIHNGVPVSEKSKQTDYLDKLGVKSGNYIIAVSRFVPEKGLDLLVKTYRVIDSKYKLVIVGDADHETKYSINLKHMIDVDNRIIRTGYITGEPLNQLFSHAKLFVLPSYHEGLPIALLEAMSYGLSVLVSDIPANLEVNISKERFFKCGDLEDLRIKMKRLLEKEISEEEKHNFQLLIKDKYNWNTIAKQTIEVYEKTISQ